MQTATQDAVAIPRQVLNMIGFYSTTETNAQKWRETVWFLLEPYCHVRAAGASLRNVTPTGQQEGAGRRNRQASNAGNAKSKETIAPRAQSVRSGSKREQLISLLRSNTAGMTRGEILDRFGLKGDKSGEMSISNALTALTKGNTIRREGGKYFLGAGSTAPQNQETRTHVPA